MEVKIGKYKKLIIPDFISGMTILEAQDKIITLQKMQCQLGIKMQALGIDANEVKGKTEEELMKMFTNLDPNILSDLMVFRNKNIKENIEYYKLIGVSFEPALEKWTFNELAHLVEFHGMKIQRRVMGDQIEISEPAKNDHPQ